MLFEGRYNTAKQLQSQLHYIWLNDTPVGFVVKNNNSEDWNIYAIHTDHLNTPRLLTNQNGAEVWRWASDAFGDSQATGSIEFNLRFPGQYYDAESSLHYNYFRDYSAQTGRYVQSDPIGLDDGPNTYLYVSANPLFYWDINGLEKIGFFIKTAKGVWKKVTKTQAKRKKDVLIKGSGSSKKAKQLARERFGSKTTRHDAHQKGELPHYQHKNGGKGHVFYDHKASIVVPAAGLGDTLFGRGTLGSNIVDFINPLSDIQDLVNLFENDDSKKSCQ